MSDTTDCFAALQDAWYTGAYDQVITLANSDILESSQPAKVYAHAAARALKRDTTFSNEDTEVLDAIFDALDPSKNTDVIESAIEKVWNSSPTTNFVKAALAYLKILVLAPRESPSNTVKTIFESLDFQFLSKIELPTCHELIDELYEMKCLDSAFFEFLALFVANRPALALESYSNLCAISGGSVACEVIQLWLSVYQGAHVDAALSCGDIHTSMNMRLREHEVECEEQSRWLKDFQGFAELHNNDYESAIETLKDTRDPLSMINSVNAMVRSGQDYSEKLRMVKEQLPQNHPFVRGLTSLEELKSKYSIY